MMGHQQFIPVGAIGRRTAAQKRYPLEDIAILGLDPAAIDRSERSPLRESLLGRHRDQVLYKIIQVSVIAGNREPYGTDHQGRSQSRRMSQSPCLGDGCIGPDQCLIRKAETEKNDAQMRLCYHLGVASGLRAERMMGIWIVKRKSRFQMGSG